MKGLIITSKGIEDTAALEVEELIKSKCKVEKCSVIFEFKKYEELCLLCYKLQSADRVINLIHSFESKDILQDLEKNLKNLDLSEWIKENKSFKVECTRIGEHNFKSVDVNKKFSEIIVKKYKDKNAKVGLKYYDVLVFTFVFGNKCYIGVDFAGFELNKRAYKIFMHPNSLRGTIAYSLVRESEFKKEEILLDPFSRDGIIPIESAMLTTNFPVNYFKKDRFIFLKYDLGINFEKFFQKIDKKIKKSRSKIFSFDHMFKFVDYSKKNAKIAGVEKVIDFSKTELEWLDVKFKKNSVDKIVTSPPTSKNADLKKIYNEFFYQAAYILKKNGKICVISRIPDFVKNHAEKHEFKVLKEKKVFSGGLELTVILFGK